MEWVQKVAARSVEVSYHHHHHHHHHHHRHHHHYHHHAHYHPTITTTTITTLPPPQVLNIPSPSSSYYYYYYYYQVGFTAEWPTWELSPLQEAAEFLASENKENESLLWSWIDSLDDDETAKETVDEAVVVMSQSFRQENHDAIWGLTLIKASSILNPLSQSLLQLYVAIKTFAPTLELHRSLRTG